MDGGNGTDSKREVRGEPSTVASSATLGNGARLAGVLTRVASDSGIGGCALCWMKTVASPGTGRGTAARDAGVFTTVASPVGGAAPGARVLTTVAASGSNAGCAIWEHICAE